jgi:plasmid maintenance system antidote protein VapI
MDLFNQEDYKLFVRGKVRAMASRGRGQYKKMAESLCVHPTLISQIFKGPRHLTPEQAAEVVAFLGLGEQEAEYFLTLVELNRAGSQRLKALLEKRRERILGQVKETSPL